MTINKKVNNPYSVNFFFYIVSRQDEVLYGIGIFFWHNANLNAKYNFFICKSHIYYFHCVMHPIMTVCFHFLHFLDGSTKKKQAEQQAAKVALQHLSGILSSLPVSATEKNFKGVLKERLDQVGFKNPIYETEESKAETSDEPVTSGMSPNLSNCEFNLKEMSKNPCIFTSKKTVTYQVLESKGFLFVCSIYQSGSSERAFKPEV